MMKNYWIATVSREHVKNGENWGIMQVCHGKKSPLQRVKQGDYVVFYSSKNKMGDKTPLQHFTAVGKALDNHVYQVKMHEGFEPFRRDMVFLPCRETAIRPLINDLAFIVNKTRWGFPFRYGLLKIGEQDFIRITQAMTVQFDEEHSPF